MTDPVKRQVKRQYESDVRREQAARTRTRIIDAAGTLFGSSGYGNTTIRQIAEAAGVAADTVYDTFGTKARVLTALIDSRLAPAGEGNVLERPEAVAVRDEPDQRRQIRLFARDIAAISARVRPVFEMLRTASAVESEIAPIYAEMENYRAANMRQAAEWIAANGELRVTTERAGEIIWALASPDIARLFCDTRGWRDDEYAAWLEDSLVRILLPDVGPDAPQARAVRGRLA
jgi:AcrR family transcriptional regulator